MYEKDIEASCKYRMNPNVIMNIVDIDSVGSRSLKPPGVRLLGSVHLNCCQHYTIGDQGKIRCCHLSCILFRDNPSSHKI